MTARTLYLLRHAKSDWGDPSLHDRERPLNERGRRATDLLAGHIEAEGIRPDFIVCSPAARARETLAGVERGFGEPPPRVEIEDRLYGATAGELLEGLRTLPQDVGSCLLIGHNPATQNLALLLAGTGEELERMRAKYPTAGLASLSFAGEWPQLDPGVMELTAFVTPKDLA